LNEYNRHGFDALKPGFRSDRGKSRKITPELERAILEKVEAFPRMKGSVIYDQLAEEGKLSPAHLSRSTFYPLLGQSAILQETKMGWEEETKRFAYKYINELWQADVMHGPALRDGRRKRGDHI